MAAGSGDPRLSGGNRSGFPLPFGISKWICHSDKTGEIVFPSYLLVAHLNDRFVARAKMHEIQMLGLLEADVLSSIEIPYLHQATTATDSVIAEKETFSFGKVEADKFDMDIFSLRTNYVAPSSTGSRVFENRNHGLTASNTITTIEESPRRIIKDLPDEIAAAQMLPVPTVASSPSQASIHSVRSTLSKFSTPGSVGQSKPSFASKLAPSWLFNPFRSGPSEPQTTQVSASASPRTAPSVTAPTATQVLTLPKIPPPMEPENSAQPLAIKSNVSKTILSRTFEEETIMPPRGTLKRSPLNTPPRDDSLTMKRRSVASILGQSFTSSPRSWSNPLQCEAPAPYVQESLARRWEHLLPEATHKHDIKWRALLAPPCLPLTMEYLPSNAELESCYDNNQYDFVVDPKEMRSFLVKPPQIKGTTEEVRHAWALAVMRGMSAVRIAQGFQFILKPSAPRNRQKTQINDERKSMRKSKFLVSDDYTPKFTGLADVLRSPWDPVYLSMPHEIHKISYKGDTIQVWRYVRRLFPARKMRYECFIWPQRGGMMLSTIVFRSLSSFLTGGYASHETTFTSFALANYGWNRLDMLVAGYERDFNESLRYWRTRFVVIPTKEPPILNTGPGGERLNDEEIRLLGIEKLAELFTKLRWQPPEERINNPAPPIRFLPTTLDPATSVLDESLMDQLDQIHAHGPLKKKMKSEREIGDLLPTMIIKAMHEEDGVPIKNYRWHHNRYPNSFIGHEFVSWLVREFNDVTSRVQAVEWGARLLEQGFFEHCRGQHGFLDG